MLKGLAVKNKSNYLKLIQQGGNYPQYTHISREYKDILKNIDVESTNLLIKQAIANNRYYINNGNEIRGINPVSGPKGFNMEKYRKENNVNINIDKYESVIIWSQLQVMNEIIPEIQTIQSGIAYYKQGVTFSTPYPYLQLPFVEFKTPGRYWKAVNEIVAHVKKHNYLTTIYYELKQFDSPIRFCILRSYINEDKTSLIADFDDTSFFENIIKCLRHIKTRIDANLVEIKLPEKGKPNGLDDSKNMYYLTNNYTAGEYIPYTHPIDGTPLTPLVVRYTDDIETNGIKAFCKVSQRDSGYIKGVETRVSKFVPVPELIQHIVGFIGIITIYSTESAFAVKMSDGSVVTWGDAECGGNSSHVQAELKQGVDTVHSTFGAFAAKMQDGSVVTWGDANLGGDSSAVQAELRQGVDTIFYNRYAFAAKMRDGSVVTWGNARDGGDSSRVQAELKQGVDTIYSTFSAFAAKMLDGSVVTWGHADCGGDSSDVQVELKQGVDTIYSTHYAFAAKMRDGSVVTWGHAVSGGNSSRVQAELKQGVDTIYSNGSAFAAKMQDGRVVTWGDSRCGGDSSRVQTELKQDVDTIYSTYYAFAAKMQDGSVVTWGDTGYGGDSSRVQAELKQGMAIIFSNHSDFAAVMRDKSVVPWGYSYR
jgi:co-chaperonin GroES (HSP10)